MTNNHAIYLIIIVHMMRGYWKMSHDNFKNCSDQKSIVNTTIFQNNQ